MSIVYCKIVVGRVYKYRLRSGQRDIRLDNVVGQTVEKPLRVLLFTPGPGNYALRDIDIGNADHRAEDNNGQEDPEQRCARAAQNRYLLIAREAISRQ